MFPSFIQNVLVVAFSAAAWGGFDLTTSTYSAEVLASAGNCCPNGNATARVGKKLMGWVCVCNIVQIPCGLLRMYFIYLHKKNLILKAQQYEDESYKRK